MTSDDVGTSGATAGVAIGRAWVPRACTLPTAERPVRLAEFDALFAGALWGQRRLAPTRLWGQRRLAPTRLWWLLDPAVEDAARGLEARESSCCSFFTFTFRPPGAGDGLVLEVEVPAAQVDVLSALAGRAAAGMAA